jgi:large conductance mechanosensitive channel
MGLVKEFKEFALKGNVIDLAVGVIIGAAFGKIVTSLVDDMIMPLLSIIKGDHDLSAYFLTLSGGHYATLEQAKAANAITLNYGLFMNNIVQFIIVAIAIFIVVRQVNRMTRKPAEAVSPAMRDCPECLAAIPADARRCRFCGQQVA